MNFTVLLKKGLVVFTIYSVITICLIMTADRIERLEKGGFSSINCGIKIGK